MVSPYAAGPFYTNPLSGSWSASTTTRSAAIPGRPSTSAPPTCAPERSASSPARGIGPDAILASACLPTLFQAVEIPDDDTGRMEAYWDGGYTGNPALFPLFTADLPGDVVVVNINPLHREELPRTARAIQNRINEISFNASLLRELRAIDFVQRLLEEGTIREGRMKRLRIHMIADDDLMRQLSVATKLVATARRAVSTSGRRPGSRRRRFSTATSGPSAGRAASICARCSPERAPRGDPKDGRVIVGQWPRPRCAPWPRRNRRCRRVTGPRVRRIR
jgi:hypothetical protein